MSVHLFFKLLSHKVQNDTGQAKAHWSRHIKITCGNDFRSIKGNVIVFGKRQTAKCKQ